MKGLIPLLLVGALTLRADDAGTTDKPAPPPAPVDEATVAHQGYPSARYQELWTKSPFAVETPEEDTTESPDYSLVGVAQIDGVSYASLIEKNQNQAHLLVSSDKPLNGLSLTSITHKTDGDTYATLMRDGQPITLKLEVVAANAALQNGGQMNAPPLPGTMTPNMPGAVPQNIPMPGTGASTRPLTRIHRPLIHIPPRTAPIPGAAAPAGQPPPPPSP